MGRSVQSLLSLLAIFGAGILLWMGFPSVVRFLGLVALEIRYLWWLILAALLGGYFVYSASRKK